MNPLLVVAAHPDDEVLGCGATMALAATAGRSVVTCFMSGSASARGGHPGAQQLRDASCRAQATLGAGDPIFGEFPNIAFNSVPHLELVQFIEESMRQVQAEEMITHHPGDLNDDHRHTSAAAQAAARLSQRGADIPPLQAFNLMEVLSSTDWSLADPAVRFVPARYVEIGEPLLAKKLTALECYSGVMRPYPHPRSREAIRAIATLRGAEAGVHLAEAFQTPFFRWKP